MSETIKVEGLKAEWSKEEIVRGVTYITANGAQFSILRVGSEKKKCPACNRGKHIYEIFGYGSIFPKNNYHFASLEAAVAYLKANQDKITKFFNWKKKIWEERLEGAFEKKDIFAGVPIRFVGISTVCAALATVFFLGQWPFIIKERIKKGKGTFEARLQKVTAANA